MVFERFRTGMVFVLRLNTIFGFKYRASTRPRLLAFKIHLENESQVGTPIRRNLPYLLLPPVVIFEHNQANQTQDKQGQLNLTCLFTPPPPFRNSINPIQSADKNDLNSVVNNMKVFLFFS